MVFGAKLKSKNVGGVFVYSRGNVYICSVIEIGKNEKNLYTKRFTK